MTTGRFRQLYWDLSRAVSNRDRWRAVVAIGAFVGARQPHVMDTASTRSVRLIEQIGAQTVLDVGANIGQYAMSLRQCGYAGKIISFEPLPQEHAQLCAAASMDENWEVFERCAVGHVNDTINMNVSENSYSSSIRAMKEAHSDAAPDAVYKTAVQTPLRTLDSLEKNLALMDGSIFLKIDTQGYEKQVIQGAAQVLGRVTGIQLELSLCELYEGQALFEEMIDLLKKEGYIIWNIFPGFENKATGRLLQFDALLCLQ